MNNIPGGKNMSKIQLVHDSCVTFEADAVVNAANRYLAAGGGICGAIFCKAGRTELQAACDRYETPLKDGEAVITPAFGIKNAKHIIHAVGPDFSVTPDAFDKLFLAYFNSLVVLRENGLHSIAFPLISSGIFGGRLNNPVAVSAEQCVKAFNAFIADNPEYDIDVSLCAYTYDSYIEAKKVFEG